MTYLEFLNKEITPFIEGDDRNQFFDELKKIPNYEAVLEILIKGCPHWAQIADQSGVHFLLDQVPSPDSKSSPQNVVELHVFNNGTVAVIKVIRYTKYKLCWGN